MEVRVDIEKTPPEATWPRRKRGPKAKYPFKKLTTPGMSFFVENGVPALIESAVRHYNRVAMDKDSPIAGWQFRATDIDDDGNKLRKDGVPGIRVYRIE